MLLNMIRSNILIIIGQYLQNYYEKHENVQNIYLNRLNIKLLKFAQVNKLRKCALYK